jgi:glycerate 2-kinase
MDPAQRREVASELIRAALEAVDPERAVTRHLRLESTAPSRVPLLWVGEDTYDLRDANRLVVVGAGKASARMAAATETLLRDRIDAGWVNVQYGYEPPRPLERIRVHGAGHPFPDQAGLEGTRQILSLLDELDEGDLVLVLLSGGASALLVCPVSGVTLPDLVRLTELLLRSGATIQEVNAVRKHLSQVKGGRLAQRIARNGANTAVMVLSDVVGSPLDAIGSGPCAHDATTFADAQNVLKRYGILEAVPRSVQDHLERGRRGQIAETPKPGDPSLEGVRHVIIADNRTAAEAAVERALAGGLHGFLLSTYLEGEAREVGRMLAALAKEEIRYERPLPRPACIVLGGETTVTIRGTGKGGRNQEVALAAALSLAGWEDAMVVTLATDGIDGPTDAAGAIATGQTVARAQAMGLDPADHLARNDSYTLFNALGDLIITGPTGTNVNDLLVVLVF